jgi:2-succinyl-6-hydroxy-2,4-cyclohexadiene-1-carboxylate synthase
VKSLVLIHGFTGSPASFRDVERQLAPERRGWRVIRPRLLGHAPDGPNSAARFEQEVDRIAAALIQTGARGAHLCGYSLGARVALGLLARHAYLFHSATLISVHPGLILPHERCERAGRDERWCRLLLLGDVSAFVDAWEAQPLFASRAMLPESRLFAHRQIRRANSCSGLIRALRVLGLAQMPSYRGMLAGLRLPVRLLVGELDSTFLAIGRELAAESPRLELKVVPGAGHDLLVESPERVASVLTQALEV